MDLIQVYVKYNLYETLELDINATTNDIKKKYKKLAIKFHPDKYLNSDELSDEEKQTLQAHFNLVNIAYDILSNEETRSLYDKSRKDYIDAGQIFDLKKQFTDFEYSYGDKSEAKKNFESDNRKFKEDQEKMAEEIRENTKRNLNKTFEIQRPENFDELMSASNKEVKKEYQDKFNSLFDSMRQKTNKHTEIMAFNGMNDMSISNYSLINGGGDGFSSLDNAFNLMDVSEKDFVDSGKTLEQRMKEYHQDFNSLKLPEPKTKQLPKFNNSDFDYDQNRFK